MRDSPKVGTHLSSAVRDTVLFLFIFFSRSEHGRDSRLVHRKAKVQPEKNDGRSWSHRVVMAESFEFKIRSRMFLFLLFNSYLMALD